MTVETGDFEGEQGSKLTQNNQPTNFPIMTFAPDFIDFTRFSALDFQAFHSILRVYFRDLPPIFGQNP